MMDREMNRPTARAPSDERCKFMKVGHQRYFTMTSEMPDAELMEIYRTLK